MEKCIIAPSVLSADFAALGKDITMLNESAAQWIHIDVMDGVFVPNISFGFPVLEAVRKHTAKICDVHLMIQQPERYIEQFRKAGADHITVHLEGNWHLDRLISQIKESGATAGVALNPSTPVSQLENIIEKIDWVLLMSVNPGFGGQQFIPNTIEKIKACKALIAAKNSHAKIQIDGGVNRQNAASLKAAGASNLVAGNAVFKADNPSEMISALMNE